MEVLVFFIDIVGNRFLYNMIRAIVGEILYILRNNLSLETMKNVLYCKDRSKTAAIVDAKGLCLEYVGYDEPYNYIERQLT